MPDQPLETDEPLDPEAQAAFEAFLSAEKSGREREEAAKTRLDEALIGITAVISEHWGSGSGRRWRQIVWSLYDGSYLVCLADVLTNFDTDNGLLVLKLIEAKLAGVLDDAMLKRVLKESGEFARYEDARRETPEDEEVLYPPMQISTERLRGLADAAARHDARHETQRRAEAAEFARLEKAG